MGGGRKAVRPSITAQFHRQATGRQDQAGRVHQGGAIPQAPHGAAIGAGRQRTRSWQGGGGRGRGQGQTGPGGRPGARARRLRGFMAWGALRPSWGLLGACGGCDGCQDAATCRHRIQGSPTRLPGRPLRPAARQRLSQGFHPCTPVVVAAVARGPDRGARAKGRGERRADPGTRQNAPKSDYARGGDSPSIAIIMPTSNPGAGATETPALRPSPGHRPEAHGP